MVKNSTMGKLRMVKAMTGRAIPRIRLLKVIYVQTFLYSKGKLCEGKSTCVVLVLEAKTTDKVERRQPHEQYTTCNEIKVERT